MRFNSLIAAALFGVALSAASIMLGYWSLKLLRASRELRHAGSHPRAEILQGIIRRTVIWIGGTIAFTAVFWFAICHDMHDRGAHRVSLPSARLP